ncbi:MAG: hypothetical protein CMJ18_18495 [Phycisphaeraceae bacterium]|nr:hypothetical protein [Phycisphaeraceae bacterium]
MALTAPVLPSRALPPDLRSLSGLSHVRVSVDALPPNLRRMGVTRKSAVARLSNRLRAGDIEIVEDQAMPLVLLRFEEALDVSAPRAIGFSATISLEQSAHVDRIQQRLRVPTFHHTRIALFDQEEAVKMIPVAIELVVDHLLAGVKATTMR